jgi:hypothetical protein
MAAPKPNEIRECFKDYRNDWQDIREEADLDMRAISVTGPWTDEDREMRENAARPCIHLDQINQFLNQVNGNVRKNKRAPKAIPKGNGANDADASKRSSLIMGIEERSQAQPIYLGAFQSMVERSYAFSVIRTEYRDDSSFDQDLVIKPIPNPDTVLLSPHYKQPNASDVPDAFILDQVPKSEFKNKYGDADITDFSGAVMGETHASDWITDRTVQVAEYWKVEHTYSKLLLVQLVDPTTGASMGPPQIFKEAEWLELKARGAAGEVKRDRKVAKPKVMQYMTNGLEILDEIEWAGQRIPIISCLGPERWTTEGGNAKRELLSMVRFARDPQMLFDFLASQECELAGMVPKVPFVGYVGQFETDAEAWDEVTKVPHPYLQADIVIDKGSNEVLPLPQRENFDAPFAEYEQAKDAAARALQASMGITPLPDAAQRRNQKSGVALEKIDDMESLGSFHFVDRYENGYLHNMAWQLNDLITPIMDTERQMPVAQPDGSRKLMHLVGNTSHPLDDQGSYTVQGSDGQQLPADHMHTGKGEFDVTISTGPAEASERAEQDDFVDGLIENIANLPAPGTPAAKVLALGIRMRPTLGPIGRQIADVFDPPPADPNMPPEAQAAIQQLQSKLQELSQENAALHADRAGKVLEQKTKLIIEQMKQDGENLRTQLVNDIKVLLGEIAAKSQDESERRQMYKEFWLENHGAAHDAGLEAMSHQHAQEIAEQSAALQPTAPPDQPQPQDGA